ncbi:MAG: 50S ribosomal protein L13 [Mariprofundales bacterium]|nr:50S ribosomal protein L13 [Mariprofundales bacterium]
MMSTWMPRPGDAEKEWFVVDARDMVLGRLASKIASILKGKHRPAYTPHIDCGDNVVVINAEKIRVTGRKETDKLYHHHTGHPGGLKTISLADQRERHPERIIAGAVKGMMPKNPLGRDMLKKLKVYVGEDHPHAAQKPVALKL